MPWGALQDNAYPAPGSTDPYPKGYLTLKARKRTPSNRRAGYM